MVFIEIVQSGAEESSLEDVVAVLRDTVVTLAGNPIFLVIMYLQSSKSLISIG